MPSLAKKLTAVLIATVLGAASCADANDVTGVPAGPVYDGIGWAGSGNRSDSTQVNNTTTTSSEPDSIASPAGIGFAGSGN
jgi:hypothetical protein